MIYRCWQFQHYLLAKKFKFFVDHQAWLYLVNKPYTTGRITRWLLLLHEFDIEIVVKKVKQHFMADHMSRIRIGEAPSGIDDELPNAPLFHIDFALEWYSGLVKFLMNEHPLEGVSKTDVRRLLR